MMVQVPVIERFRQPQYTGRNRCLPCTVLNVAITIASAGFLAGALVTVGWQPSMAGTMGLLLLGFGLATIYVRGYLIPGTPMLTARYAPDWVDRVFGEASDHPTDTDSSFDFDFDVESALSELGVVTECPDVDDLCLTADFAAAWRRRQSEIDPTTVSTDAITRVFDVDSARIAVADHGSARVVRLDGHRIGQWESPAAFVADLAAADVLADHDRGWHQLEWHHRGAVLNGLRLFLEQCPTCGDPVTLEQETVRSCCRSGTVYAVTCTGCGDRIFEAEPPPDGREMA